MQAKPVVDKFSIEQIVPYFQPIFDLRKHKVVSYECLARLITANDNVYLPADFLTIVQRSQSNASLTQRIIELSSAYCVPRRMQCSVNLFPSDLRNANLINWMQDLCDDSYDGLVGVELNYESVKAHAHLLRNLMNKMPRLQITVDDVDSFENELIEIIKTGVHAIKLSGNMVTRFANTGEGKTTIENIIQQCKTSNCMLIAEHIESDNILDAVMNLGIDFGQGYSLSEPAGRMSSLKQV